MLTSKQKNRIGLSYVIDLIEPASPYGKEALRELKPYMPGEEKLLNQKLENISKISTAMPGVLPPIIKLEQIFSQVKNIRASIEKIGEQLSEIDLFEIKRYLIQLEQMLPIYSELYDCTCVEGFNFEGTDKALELIDPEDNRVATFHISGKNFPVLSEIRKEKKAVEQRLRELQSGLPETKQTELTVKHDKLRAERMELAAREQREEQKAMLWFSDKLNPYKDAMLKNTDEIAKLDLTIQKAKLAARYKACLPATTSLPTQTISTISFINMTNPQLDRVLSENGETFTPLTIELAKGTTVITGANMGGKSVALKTLALNVMLVQYGFFPFAESAVCPLIDRIYLVSDDLEATDRGLSSFGGEIVKLQEILDNLGNKQTLILLDEFARGTNPAEGGTIARAVCSYLNKQESMTVMTTHYEGVAPLAKAHYQVAGLRKMEQAKKLPNEIRSIPVSERVKQIASYMDYGLLKVTPDRKLPEDAINICKMLGLSEEIMSLMGVSYEIF